MANFVVESNIKSPQNASPNKRYTTPPKIQINGKKDKETSLMTTVTKASTGKKNFIPRPVY